MRGRVSADRQGAGAAVRAQEQGSPAEGIDPVDRAGDLASAGPALADLASAVPALADRAGAVPAAADRPEDRGADLAPEGPAARSGAVGATSSSTQI